MTGNDVTKKRMNRREFLRFGGLVMVALGALLAGCRPAPGTEPSPQTSTDADSQIAVATATPMVQQSATATPTVQQSVRVACPFGRVNDPYPGRCKAYRDSNNDGYCDYSMPGSGNVPARES